MQLIDTHAHLFAEEYQDSLDDVLQRAAEAGVAAIICVGLDLPTSEQAVALADIYPNIWAAVGVHGGFHVSTVIAGTLLPPVTPATSWLAIGSVQSVIGVALIVTALRHGRRIPDGTTARP